jgi:phospholipid/cholesterol/gamma-HCH transport system permease protein
MDVRVPTDRPEARVSSGEDGMTVALAGRWTVSNAQDAEAAIDSLDVKSAKNRVVIDLGEVTDMDTAGAWLIHRERARAEFAGRRVEITRASERVNFLLGEIERHIPQPPERARQPYILVRALVEMGRTMTIVWRDAVSILSILGVFGLRLGTICTHFYKLRGTSIIANFDRTCRGAVPIVMLMSFLIGLIIAQQGGFYLRQFGADLFVVDLAGVLILREIGVLLAAILVAGRSGSAFTAEIGSMRMREEVDALNVLGLDPVEVLVVPRLMALMLALPVLTFLSDIAAIAGAALVSWFYLGITPDLFFQRLDEAVTPIEFYIGIAKAPFMALIIGLVACNEGLKVGGSAESLGRHTTIAVVKAIFLVIVVDGFFAVFFASVGI